MKKLHRCAASSGGVGDCLQADLRTGQPAEAAADEAGHAPAQTKKHQDRVYVSPLV